MHLNLAMCSECLGSVSGVLRESSRDIEEETPNGRPDQKLWQELPRTPESLETPSHV